MAHIEIIPEQAIGPRTQVLLLPCPIQVKGCVITKGMKLLSQTASATLVPTGCQALCSQSAAPSVLPWVLSAPRGTVDLKVQLPGPPALPVVTQAQHGLAEVTHPPTASPWEIEVSCFLWPPHVAGKAGAALRLWPLLICSISCS